MRAGLVTALEMTGSRSKEVWKPYWSAQQRFFKLLCVSLKARLAHLHLCIFGLVLAHAVVAHLSSRCTCFFGRC